MREIHRLAPNDSSILSIAVSDLYIFAGHQSHVITVHDLTTFACLKELKGHNGAVLSLTLSPCGRKLFSSAGDSIARVWCTTTLTCLSVIFSAYDVGDVFSTAYCSSNDTLYLGAQNTSLQWVNLSVKRPVKRDLYPTRRPNKFFDSTGPSGRAARRTSTVDEENLVLIDKDDIIQYAHYSYVYTLLLGIYDGQEVIFSGGGDAAINIWSLEPKQIRSLCQGSAAVLCLAQHESLLYAGHAKGVVAVWDLETNQLLRRIQAHEDDVLAMSMLDQLYTAGGSCIKSWNHSSEKTGEIEAHAGRILCLAPNRVISGGNDKQIAVWQGNSTDKSVSDDPDAFMASLRKFCSYPSISGGTHVEECRRAASFLRGLASDLGAEASLIPTEHNPIVLIKFKATKPGRSLLYYGHYDVISANADTWTSSPWTLTGRNGYLYARGVTDNKAPILSALYAAHELQLDQQLGSDITFLIEGEEESGSRGFIKAITDAKTEIGHIDEVFLSNSYWLDDHLPCLTYGLRGVIQARISIENELPDLHSGVDGGSIREPTIDLVNLLGKLTKDDGTIALPDFYNPVRAADTDLQYFEDITKLHLSSRRHREASTEELMNRWCRPSLTIHKIEVSGPGNSTVIPHSASANISMRIVPDQSLETIANTLRTYLSSQYEIFKSQNKLNIEILSTSDWWLSPPSSASFTKLRQLIKKHWSLDALMVREGGSIPMIKFLERTFDATATNDYDF